MTREARPESLEEAPSRNRQRARARELTLHASILAVAVWLAVAADLVSPGPWGRFSNTYKGKDFVQFYVMGSLVRTGSFQTLVDPIGFRRAQDEYFRPDNRTRFPPVYGPHIALLLAPLSALPYLAAYAVWALLTVLAVGWSVWACWRFCPPLKQWPAPVAAIAAAYPPLGYLVLAGQLSALALVALTLAVLALARNSPVLAGAAIGLLGYKASLLAPAVAVCLLAGEAVGVAVATAIVAASVLLAGPIVGLDVLRGYAENIIGFAEAPDLLAKNTFLMASLRTFWGSLLPQPAAMIAYSVSAAGCLVLAARGWRRTRDPLVRVGLLSIAIVLASPHFYFYDLVILVPAFMASAGILVNERARALRWCTYLAYFAPLAAPVAAFWKVQPVTVVLAVWLVALSSWAAVVEPVAPLAETRS